MALFEKTDPLLALEVRIAELRVRLEHALDVEAELRGRVHALEVRNDRLLRRILRLSRPPMGEPATPGSTVLPAAAAAAAAPAGPTLGPKTLRAVNTYAGRDRQLGQHLMREALGMLAEDQELTDEQIAARIIEGEDPEGLDDGDDAIASASGRVIPGGSA